MSDPDVLIGEDRTTIVGTTAINVAKETSNVLVEEDRTTVAGHASVSVDVGAPSTVELDPAVGTVRLGGGEGRNDTGNAIDIDESVTISAAGRPPGRDGGDVSDGVYISGRSPGDDAVSGNGPWGGLVPLALDGGQARVSVGGQGEDGSLSVLQSRGTGPVEAGRIDAETATVSVGSGAVQGNGTPGSVELANGYGLTNCQIDASEAQVTLGSGGTGGGGSDDGSGDSTGGVDSIPDDSGPGSELEGALSGEGGTDGSIELVAETGATAGFVRAEESGTLVLADEGGTPAVRIDDLAGPDREVALLDGDGNAALAVDGDGVVTVGGSEVATK